ncbi:MAG: protein of unknown function DUF755 [Anelloviridae sp.]|uniref:DUF755 domain-containing protein n=1 Tax=Anelloviridae sp. TaxID=2055263 RepID=A0A385E246_9VIRU|nr:MAG: protein of unknown function DUF755 [Anelloviridae sp.]AXQ65810.1 MAG: protein of unknown function DUF755 [Anelloviridae sp.]
MKLLTQLPQYPTTSTSGTPEGTFLHKQLNKELLKSTHMNNLCLQMERKLQQKSLSKSSHKHHRKQPRKKKKKRYSSSSSSTDDTTNNSSTDSSN